MKQVAVVVEGQTEEAFVARVLAPHLANLDVYLTPIIVETSRAASGKKHKGGGTWSQYKRDLLRLLGESHWDLVTTMLDFYGYPTDGPGAECDQPHDARACVAAREAAMASELSSPRFRAFVMLHEFETLVFGAALSRVQVLGSNAVASALKAEAALVAGDVELMNDHPATAPSKRIVKVWADYQKVTDGVAAADEAGLDALRVACPHFGAWVEELER